MTWSSPFVWRASALVLLAASAWGVQRPAIAQALPKPQPPVIKQSVSPAPAPRGALRIRLLPEYLDRKTGNRATLYYRAIVMLQQKTKDEGVKFEKDRERWQAMPLDKLPRDEVRKALAAYNNVLKEVATAAWMDHCDWGLRLRELTGVEPIMLLLPEVQEIRQLARVLSLKCRLEVAEGRLADAQKTLQTMFQLARDIAETPTLVNALVGMAIVSVTTNELQQYVQRADAPNLYWALTTLPRPLVDLREAAEQERSFPLQLIPAFRDIEKPRTAEEWRAELLTAVQLIGTEEGVSARTGPNAELALTVLLLKGYPIAKRALIEQGRDPKAVEAMPAAQVVAIQMLDTYHYAWGEVFKCFYLPYPQAAAEYAKVDKRLKAEAILAPASLSKEVIPLAGLLLPAVANVLTAQARTDRQIAELCCIEALRMHAAEHGHWPQALNEITTVPVPDDPATGKPFVYRVEGDKAVLESIATSFMHPAQARRFELTLRK